MKHAKKLASLLLTLLMVIGMMAVPAFAAIETGVIEVKNATVGETYNVYLIFELKSYDSNGGAYLYKLAENSPWSGFVNNGDGKDYVSIDENGYVTWNSNKNTEKDKDAFAKAALLYAQQHEIEPTQSESATTTNVEFSNLYPKGYFLVDSSLGTMASLDTTDPYATVTDKNIVPNVEKKVKDGNTYGDSNSAFIGKKVEFQTIITVRGGARKYVLHDEMTGLKFDENSVKVQYQQAAGVSGDGNYVYAGGLKDVGDSNYTLKNPVDSCETYNECTFEISFGQDFLDTLNVGDQIVVTYSGTVTKDAVVGEEGNPNKTKVTYGNSGQSSQEDETKTYTYSFDLVKTKKDNTVLDGAYFKLYDAKTDGNKISLVKVDNVTYRVATAEEEGATSYYSPDILAGKVTIKGLASGTYYLEETVAPSGYHALSERVEVKIENANLTATVENNTWKDGGVHVINNTGSELPETGGMGTTIFYVLGGALMLGAVILLITKKRMGQTEK